MREWCWAVRIRDGVYAPAYYEVMAKKRDSQGHPYCEVEWRWEDGTLIDRETNVDGLC